MFENATNLPIRPGMLEEAVLVFRESVLPILREQPGLLSLDLIPAPFNGVLSVLTIWATPACARAVEALPAYRRAVRRLDPLLVAEPGGVDLSWN